MLLYLPKARLLCRWFLDGQGSVLWCRVRQRKPFSQTNFEEEEKGMEVVNGGSEMGLEAARGVCGFGGWFRHQRVGCH